jgi:phosphatidylcholine synthase
MVPVALLVRLDLIESEFSFLYAALIIFTGALWFARTDQETEDHWFNGFPAAWNLVIPTFIILDTNVKLVEILIILLCVLTLTTLKFPHMVKVEFMRPVTWTLAFIYFVSLTWLSVQYPNGPSSLEPVLVIFPLYIFAISIYHTWKVRNMSVSSVND